MSRMCRSIFLARNIMRSEAAKIAGVSFRYFRSLHPAGREDGWQ